MGIVAKAIYGEPIELRDGEQIHVRLVDVSNDRTGTVSTKVDVRIYITSDKYTGWSKNGFQTADPSVLRDLANTLLSAAADAETKGVAPDADTSVQQVPVVPVTPAVNPNSVAARKYAARKAAAAKPAVGTSRTTKPTTRTRRTNNK